MKLKRKMNAYANMDLRMPVRYTDMSETEMECYGGSWDYNSIFNNNCTEKVVEGMVGGAIAGALYGAVTGPFDPICIAGGAITGGSVAAVQAVVENGTGKSITSNVSDWVDSWKWW